MSKLLIFSHFFNEQEIIEEWIDRHYYMADCLILVNDHSDDKSVNIVQNFEKRVSPPSRKIRVLNTKREWFSASALDQEMMEIEAELDKEFPGSYKLCLNTTELLVANPKDALDYYSNQIPAAQAFAVGSYVMVGNKSHYGFYDQNQEIRRYRYIHKAPHGHYQLGRHSCNLPAIDTSAALRLHWRAFAPWNEAMKKRRMQIQTRIPESDKASGLGFEHFWTEEQLEDKVAQYEARSVDLLIDPAYPRRAF